MRTICGTILAAAMAAASIGSVNAECVAEFDAKGVVVNGEVVCDVECRTFPDGEAARYRLPDGVATVSCERTEWRLPADAHIWYQPQSSCYEASFKNCRVGEASIGEKMNLPITARLSDGTYRLLTEANVVDYTDSCVEYCGDGRFAIRYYADEKGFARSGVPHTPWRVTLVAKDLQTLATSDIVRRLCPDPSPEVAAKCAAFVKPGKCVWQWLPAGDPKYGEQKEWYDRTKALGFEYYLIDDGWKVWRDGDMDQWACLRKWIDYGKSIGVESFVWVDSKEMRTTEARRAYLKKVKGCGAVGIKIDFVPEPSCSQMKWYEETLADTLEFSLMTDFHGCVKPSGRERTWPHEVAREAIRGHEWHITRYSRVLPPEHDCILPFNRLAQGHADYTPMVFEKKELQGYTWARELAQGVVFSARFLCFGDYPQNYLDNPAVELIKSMPAEYDETRILPGSEIGKCVAVAKRKGRDWFVAVENGTEERQITIKLDFLAVDDCELLGFADAEDKPDGYRIDRRAVERDGKIELTLRPCGGYCARISPTKGSTFADKDGSCPVSTNVRGHENIEWSTAYAYGLTDGTKDLPRVLLIGDSICNGYQEGVRERLKGKVNVSYWVSSYCATSAAYLPLLTIYLDEAKYDVIHFNNGLHSLETPTDAWAKGFKAALELIRRKQPEAKIVWCTSTPLANEVKTAKSRELNAAGAKVVAELGGIETNDLFALCDPLDRATNWSDVYHFRKEAKAMQADQVAAAVLSAVSVNGRPVPSPELAARLAEMREKIEKVHAVKTVDKFYGCDRIVFDFDGHDAWVVCPKGEASLGKPWTWTMQWATAFVPRTNVPQMLNDGFHHVTIDTFRHRMDEEGLKVSAAFQKFLVEELGFAPKTYLIGMSWGGFFSTRYAANYPQNVAKIYLDAPLLCFKDFNQGIGTWTGKMPEGGWDTSSEMPLNMAERIAAADIPVLLLYGGVDAVVPPTRNCEPFAKRFKAAGGDITVVKRGLYAHHPHGVEVDETTIKDFFCSVGQSSCARPAKGVQRR